MKQGDSSSYVALGYMGSLRCLRESARIAHVMRHVALLRILTTRRHTASRRWAVVPSIVRMTHGKISPELHGWDVGGMISSIDRVGHHPCAMNDIRWLVVLRVYFTRLIDVRTLSKLWRRLRALVGVWSSIAVAPTTSIGTIGRAFVY